MAYQDTIQRIEVDPKVKIGKISMLVQGGFNFLGIRLFDDKGNVFAKKVWCSMADADVAWVTKEIEGDTEVIGLQAFTDKDRFCRLGWLLWHPRIKDRKVINKNVETAVTKKAYQFDHSRRKESLERIRFNVSRRMASLDSSP